MKKPLIYTTILGFSTLTLFAQEEAARPLLDDSLSQWEVFIGVPHESVEVPGGEKSTSKDGMNGVPLGLGNDPLKVFTTIKEGDETVLHVSGQIYGALSSKEEFENYHLSLQMKWGEKKWEPRLNQRRDSGLLFHATGKHASFWNVWMSSLECQIQEHDCGDFIPLAGTKATIRAVPNPAGKGPHVYDPTAVPRETSGYTAASTDADKPNGEWNTIELYVLGDDAVFVVNGIPNMALTNAKMKDQPLTKGKLQIQSEAAEVFYKNITIKPLTEFPEKLAALVAE
ncbi:DUF1080 domain-containing protein [Luteolibacter algae]|uniref:DUF1080 domain-containing protein n=1 Tax=Luteolibacter algae TaxID=454151 RepID=A0ABW5D9U8_9BACT